MNSDSREEIAMDRWPKISFAGILAAFIVILFIAPIMVASFYANLLMHIGFTFLMLSLIFTIFNERSVVFIGFALAAPFIIINGLSFFEDSLKLMIISYFFSCIFLIWIILILANRLYNETFIDTNLIFGVITVYILSGILWAKMFCIIEMLSPDSFAGIKGPDQEPTALGGVYYKQFNLLYYSFTTLSTLGLGDISPKHALAKSLTGFEAIYGQLFVATVVAKLVSIWKKD